MVIFSQFKSTIAMTSKLYTLSKWVIWYTNESQLKLLWLVTFSVSEYDAWHPQFKGREFKLGSHLKWVQSMTRWLRVRTSEWKGVVEQHGLIYSGLGAEQRNSDREKWVRNWIQTSMPRLHDPPRQEKCTPPIPREGSKC